MKSNKISMAGVVIAGGLSSRMQQDKKFLQYQNKTFLDIAIDNLKPLCQSVFLSLASSAEFSASINIIEDEFKNMGPIAGIFSCLNYKIQEDYILFLPVDMPLLTPQILKNLIANIKNKKSNGINYENHVFPFIIKNSQEVLHILQNLINKNSYSIKNFLAAVNSISLPIAEEDKKHLQNINYYEQFLGLPNA
ncbi:MAG: molybdenum cofactor guanylyltransferase [Alphaproteobacteria bacterium]|nr:molybdenum cofactor guanylyltransferase [Alphaproteobacteria bacterium]